MVVSVQSVLQLGDNKIVGVKLSPQQLTCTSCVSGRDWTAIFLWMFLKKPALHMNCTSVNTAVSYVGDMTAIAFETVE